MSRVMVTWISVRPRALIILAALVLMWPEVWRRDRASASTRSAPRLCATLMVTSFARAVYHRSRVQAASIRSVALPLWRTSALAMLSVFMRMVRPLCAGRMRDFRARMRLMASRGQCCQIGIRFPRIYH